MITDTPHRTRHAIIKNGTLHSPIVGQFFFTQIHHEGCELRLGTLHRQSECFYLHVTSKSPIQVTITVNQGTWLAYEQAFARYIENEIIEHDLTREVIPSAKSENAPNNSIQSMVIQSPCDGLFYSHDVHQRPWLSASNAIMAGQKIAVIERMKVFFDVTTPESLEGSDWQLDRWHQANGDRVRAGQEIATLIRYRLKS